MTQEDDLALLQGVYRFHLALVGNSGLTEESFKKSQERGRDAFNDILGLLRPWEGKTAKERQSREVEDLRQAYIAAFGDYRDPEWQARQDAAIAAWVAGTDAELAKEDEWERVERLKAEQAANVERLQKQQQLYRPKLRPLSKEAYRGTVVR